MISLRGSRTKLANNHLPYQLILNVVVDSYFFGAGLGLGGGGACRPLVGVLLVFPFDCPSLSGLGLLGVLCAIIVSFIW